jgi:hypothetical protein
MDMYVHVTPLVALIKKRADIGVYLHPEKAEPVENRPDSSQGTDVSAEWLMHKDGESHQSEKDKKFDVEQESHPGDDTPSLTEDVAAGIPQHQRNTGFQAANRTKFAKPRFTHPERHQKG